MKSTLGEIENPIENKFLKEVKKSTLKEKIHLRVRISKVEGKEEANKSTCKEEDKSTWGPIFLSIGEQKVSMHLKIPCEIKRKICLEVEFPK